MKRILLTTLAAFMALYTAGAQVILSKDLTPVDSHRYYPHYPGVKNNSETLYVASFRYTNGFHLERMYSDRNPFVKFSLKGQYEKLSFVMGPGRLTDDRWKAGDKDSEIVIVKADGRRIVDEVIHCWDAPKEFVLDVTGVDILEFEHFSGDNGVYVGVAKLWKKGQPVVHSRNPLDNIIDKDKVKLVEELRPHLICHRGWSKPITSENWGGIDEEEYISINRVKYTSGLALSASEELGDGISAGFAYFWLQKKFDKLSFIVGPRDNKSSSAKSWLVVKGDGKILLEKLVSQTDLAEVVVLDVKNVNVVSFHCGELEASKFLGGMTFGVVDIYAYKNGSPDIPVAGLSSATKSRLAQLPEAVKLCSTIPPYSVQGIANYDNSYFDGASSHYHFSMGGEQFDEGFILTTGTTFMDGNISSYYAFDLAGEFDYVSFTVGTLSKHRVLGEDRLLVYADDNLILDTDVHCLWPNQKFTLPLAKCRVLKFAKPGNGENKQTFIGVGDVMVFRRQPQDTAPYFYHPRPESPETVDLIDYCQAPYFHYVGRYLSNLTNFDFNDCFKNGSSQRDAFVMKDGSRITKGIMLETNVPPALVFEDIDLNTAIFLFIVGAGSSISASNVAAATGISAGAGLAGALAAGYSTLNLVGDKGHQSAVAAFNPFGEYETLTFTVANKSEYVDEPILGVRNDPANPVQLKVFADMRLVGDFSLSNFMQPTTWSVPIGRCTQLVFWLQCGDSRSGQYVLYDMELSKTPLEGVSIVNAGPAAPIITTAAQTTDDNLLSGQAVDEEVRPASVNTQAGKKKAKKEKKAKERVVWGHPDRSSRVNSIDQLIRDVDEVWDLTCACLDRAYYQSYRITETYVQSQSGRIFKAVSLVNASNERLNIKDVMAFNEEAAHSTSPIEMKIAAALIGVPAANLGIVSLEGDRLFEFPSVVRMAPKALNQCSEDLAKMVSDKENENAQLQALLDAAVDVGSIASTSYVLLLPLARGEQAPEGNTLQRLEYYRMN